MWVRQGQGCGLEKGRVAVWLRSEGGLGRDVYCTYTEAEVSLSLQQEAVPRADVSTLLLVVA